MSKQLTILISIFAVVFSSVFFSTANTLSAEDTYWEGGISISSYGELPRSGFYAATNAFPSDTKVKVRNSETGETVEVRVVERLEDPHLFMLVSQEAGRALGIAEDEIVKATVSPVRDGRDIASPTGVEDPAYSLDPDRNPMAGIERIEEPEDSEGLSLLRDYLGEEEPSEEEPEEPSEEEPEESPELAEIRPETEEPEESEEPETEEPEESEEPSVTIIREAEETPKTSETDFSDPEVPDEPAGETEGETEKEIPSTDTLTIAERPADRVDIKEELPRPQIREEREERAEVTPPERETDEERIVEGPMWDEVEPLFARQRDTGYSPPFPIVQEHRDREETGPVPSMVYLETREDGKEMSYTAAEPELPEVERGVAEIDGVSPAEDELEVAELHTPEVQEDTEKERAGTPIEEKPAEEESAEEPEESPIPEDAEIVLSPAEERPPEGKPDSEFVQNGDEEELDTPSAKEEEPAPREREDRADEELIAEANHTETLTPSSYYLQLAAYQKIEAAERLAVKLLPRYPVTIYEGRDETFPYKVMVGPLNEDESGALLYSFTSRGYRDAFLRRGN